jgi:hypothetical protein
MTVSESICTLLVQCLYCICVTWFISWPRDYVLLQSFIAHIWVVPYNLLMSTSFGFILDLHLPYHYVALLHDLCRLQSIIPSLPVWVMASPVFCGVSKQCRFYKVGLIAPRPTAAILDDGLLLRLVSHCQPLLPLRWSVDTCVPNCMVLCPIKP